MNGIMMQYFEWYLPDDGSLWRQLEADASHLQKMGVTAVWIPPCYKGQSSDDVGYGAYDLYDLGEFDQKNTIRTKYGTKAELKKAIKALHDKQIQVYADAVINHKAGADEKECFSVVKVNPENREEVISEPFEIEGWTKFNYPVRNNKYSAFKWYHQHFTAVDYDQRTGENGIFKILGPAKDFSENVTDTEKGNFDYLMHADVDFNNPDVVEEIKRWGKWFIEELDLDGLRIDALKHVDLVFVNDFIQHLLDTVDGGGKQLFFVGEYWYGDQDILLETLGESREELTLFDVPLHFRFHDASLAGQDYDLRKIFDETLISSKPIKAITFVDNHDSQPGQALESWVADWFKPLAYAMILLRQSGYPCIFYGDYYGSRHEPESKSFREILDKLVQARQDYAYGPEELILDDPNCIAIRREGDPDKEGSGLICILSNGPASEKELQFEDEAEGTVFVDLTGHITAKITLDKDRKASFPCPERSLSVWVKEGER